MTAHQHAVLFYEHSTHVDVRLKQHVLGGLRAGGGALIVATEARRAKLCDALRDEDMAKSELEASGRLTLLDAAETLSKIMVAGAPDEKRFQSTLAPIIARATTASRKLVAFGEMVAILWRKGMGGAALKLEALWGELTQVHGIDLLCAYCVRDFDSEEDGQALAKICAIHSRVVPAESYIPENDAERMASVVRLQHRAVALETALKEKRALAEAAGDVERTGHGESLLIVEDDPALALELQEVLSESGYRVTGVANDKEQALALAANTRPDLVLMDVGLGRSTDGIDTVVQLRAELSPGPAVVYLTGRADDATLRRVRATDNQGYLLKPFTTRQVQTAIKLALERHRREQLVLVMERSYAASAHRSTERLLADLHDQVGQPLIGVSFLCRLIKSDVPEAQAATIARIEDLVNTATGRLATIIRQGYLAPFEATNLALRLEKLCAQAQAVFGVNVHLDVEPGADDEDTLRANELCLIAQEALTNAVRHGGARNVYVALRQSGSRLTLSVDDDGSKQTSTSKSSGIGIRMMEYRSRLCGATLALTAVADGATQVTCSWLPTPSGAEHEENGAQR